MLEGISTPKNVVFIITSSQKLPNTESDVFVNAPTCLQEELQGLLRRIRCIEIPCLDMDTATAFLQSFLESYVPRCKSLDMSDANRMAIVSFAHAWCNWDESVSVPFDMFSKYLEHAVRNVYVSDTRPQHEKLTAAGEFVPKN